MEAEEKIDRVVEILYAAYGTDSGYLFGIPPSHRFAVRAIVKAVIRELEEKGG